METLRVINLIGPPGSGKSTQAELIVSRLEFGYVATGDIIRRCTPGYEFDSDEAERYRSEYSSLLFPFLVNVSQAKLIPNSVMVPILINELSYQVSKGTHGIVIAGSIKNANQAEGFRECLLSKEKDLIVRQTVVRLDAADNTLLKRLKERSAKNSRPDDGIIIKMLANYRGGESELNNYYAKLQLLTNVWTDGKDIETVYQIIQSLIDR